MWQMTNNICTLLVKSHSIKRGEKVAYSERELLARIIQCEAGGEGHQGMMAVAPVFWWRTFNPRHRNFENSGFGGTEGIN